MVCSRRRFLVASAATLWGSNGLTWALSEGSAKIAFSTWSLHNYFPTTRSRPRFATEDWTLQEAIVRMRDRYGFRHFEISSAHLASTESSYLEEIKDFFAKERCQIIHLSDNFRGVNLARSNPDEREADMNKYRQWIDIAARIGSPSMRVNTGGPSGNDWDFTITIDCFRQLARYAKPRNVQIIVENHFGLSADPANVVRIVKEVGENISACPDFGLFSEAQRQTGLELMTPFSRHVCSAKFHDFDMDGMHRDFDFRGCLGTLHRMRFPGWASLEYQGMQEPFRHIELAKKIAAEVL